MKPIDSSDIQFVRLPEISPDRIMKHMSNPRVAAHLPLMTSLWVSAQVQSFVTAKEMYWKRDGLGHWAMLHKGDYVGWGGFQREGKDWDYGLVLTADSFGLGNAITRKALEFARNDPRISSVTFLLPPTRRNLGALRRLGAVSEGMVTYDDAGFQKFRLQTP